MNNHSVTGIIKWTQLRWCTVVLLVWFFNQNWNFSLVTCALNVGVDHRDETNFDWRITPKLPMVLHLSFVPMQQFSILMLFYINICTKELPIYCELSKKVTCVIYCFFFLLYILAYFTKYVDWTLCMHNNLFQYLIL